MKIILTYDTRTTDGFVRISNEETDLTWRFAGSYLRALTDCAQALAEAGRPESDEVREEAANG